MSGCHRTKSLSKRIMILNYSIQNKRSANSLHSSRSLGLSQCKSGCKRNMLVDKNLQKGQTQNKG